MFVIVTGSTLRRAMSVGIEVGRSHRQGKLIIPLVEPGISPTELGKLAPLTCIWLDPKDPAPTIAQASAAVSRWKANQQETAKAFLAVGAFIALVCFLAKES